MGKTIASGGNAEGLRIQGKWDGFVPRGPVDNIQITLDRWTASALATLLAQSLPLGIGPGDAFAELADSIHELLDLR